MNRLLSFRCLFCPAVLLPVSIYYQKTPVEIQRAFEDFMSRGYSIDQRVIESVALVLEFFQDLDEFFGLGPFRE